MPGCGKPRCGKPRCGKPRCGNVEAPLGHGVDGVASPLDVGWADPVPPYLRRDRRSA
jgi:hypothetical protein